MKAKREERVDLHAAFTIIELIFVIIILGVLASMALPKFLGVREEAQTQIIQSFAATMTRTVGHVLWSQSLANGHNGSITYDTSSQTVGGKKLDAYVDIPVQLDASSVNFDRCIEGGGEAQPFIQAAEGYAYNLFCRDGNMTNAPKFVAAKSATHVF